MHTLIEQWKAILGEAWTQDAINLRIALQQELAAEEYASLMSEDNISGGSMSSAWELLDVGDLDLVTSESQDPNEGFLDPKWVKARRAAIKKKATQMVKTACADKDFWTGSSIVDSMEKSLGEAWTKKYRTYVDSRREKHEAAQKRIDDSPVDGHAGLCDERGIIKVRSSLK